MRKTKFLALTLAVAVMMMGAGYAYWTDEITINSTVDTGNLEVTFLDDPDPEAKEDIYMFNSKSDVNDNDPSKLDVELVNAYPGAVIPVQFDLKNTGTLAAYVKNFKIVSSEAGDGLTDLANHITCTKLKVDGVEKTIGDGTVKNALKDIEIYLQSENKADKDNNLITRTVRMDLKIDENLNDKNFEQDDTSDNEQATYGFTIKADVKQYNEIEGKPVNVPTP